jgi:hypothetical protein
MKLKHLSMHNIENVPKETLKKMEDAAIEMIEILLPFIKHTEPNILMSSICFVHASILKHIISDKDGEFEKAAKLNALSLIENCKKIEHL